MVNVEEHASAHLIKFVVQTEKHVQLLVAVMENVMVNVEEHASARLIKFVVQTEKHVQPDQRDQPDQPDQPDQRDQPDLCLSQLDKVLISLLHHRLMG
jgi:hypothetical protein